MEEWKTYKLSDLCLKVTDGSHFSPAAQETGYPMFSVKDMLEYGFDYSKCKRISRADFDIMKNSGCVPEEGDVLVAKDGSYLKQIFVCRRSLDEAILSSIAIFRPDRSKILPDYLCYLIKSPKVYDYISKNCVSGSALPRIVLKAFKEVELEVPSLVKQEKIVSMLKCIDEKIILNNRINHNLEEQAQALYKSWFVDFEPFKDGKFVYSELGLIPEGWRIGKISDIATVTSGKRPNVKYESSSVEHSIPVFGASSVMAFTDSVYLKERAIITGRVGTLGILQRVDFPCWPSDNTLIIQSLYENFVYQELGEVDYSSLNRGSTQPLLTQSDLKSWSIIIPPKEIIAEYESLIRDNTDLIAEHCVQNQRLSLLRDTLLPQLMSGQLTC